MIEPRLVNYFPKSGNHIGDRIKLPSGKIYTWIKFKRWQKS